MRLALSVVCFRPIPAYSNKRSYGWLRDARPEADAQVSEAPRLRPTGPARIFQAPSISSQDAAAMGSNKIDARQLLEVVRPGLARGDAGLLAQEILRRWTPAQVCTLLDDSCTDVRRVAAVTLGLIGSRQVEANLAHALHDRDAQVNELAEHSLWSIWPRAGDRQAAKSFREGWRCWGRRRTQAAECFLKATRIDPQFAEAYNQCAIAHFFVGHWEESLHFSNRTIKLVPVHFKRDFGDVKHCYCQLGDLTRAMQYYKWALRINPRMSKIAGAIERVEQRMRDINDSSGMFTTPAVGV